MITNCQLEAWCGPQNGGTRQSKLRVNDFGQSPKAPIRVSHLFVVPQNRHWNPLKQNLYVDGHKHRTIERQCWLRMQVSSIRYTVLCTRECARIFSVR